MYVIGLTGGIGSGKTTVADMLREKGAVILSADRLGHQVYRPGTPAWQAVVDAFGRQVLASDGSIDRQKLGAIVFADAEARKRLNAITHPPMREMMRQRLADLASQGTAVAVLEAALLLDAGWDDLVDEVWVTALPAAVAAQRIAARGALTYEEALARIRAQLSDEERIKRADVVIDTDCSLAETRRQVEEQWSRLLARLGLPAGEAGSPSASRGV